MNEKQFKQALERVVQHDMPDNLDLWPSLQIHLKAKQNQNQSRSIFMISTRRVGWIVLVIFLLLFTGTASYALSPTFRNLIHQDSGLEQIDSDELGKVLNLSQTVDDVTVTLNWAYSDASRTSIAYTITDPTGHRYEPIDFILTDEAGTIFPPTVGLGATQSTDGLGAELSSGEGVNVLSFDTSPKSLVLSVPPEEINLHLELTLQKFTQNLSSGTSIQRSENTVGPMAFDFTSPYYGGYIVESNQTINAASINGKLVKVIIAPSEMMATICFYGLPPEYNVWLPISHIDVATEETTIRAEVSTQTNLDGEGCSTNHYLPSLYDHNGTWSLTVTELVGISPEPGLDQLRLNGPWTFEFELP